MTPAFENLVAEGESLPVEGWDFSWFEGRATQARPSWGYASMLVERVGQADAVLDLETGGGEVLAWVLSRAQAHPVLVVATESWRPNLHLASRTLGPLNVFVAEADDTRLPFSRSSFDLVASRHPVVTAWSEIARVLVPGGTYFSQQVGPGSVRELTDFVMGPQPVNEARSVDHALSSAEAAGLEVRQVRREELETVFYDIAAVVHFLRKVPWIVPGFTAGAYRPHLRALHELIVESGSFVAHARSFLIEATLPH